MKRTITPVTEFYHFIVTLLLAIGFIPIFATKAICALPSADNNSTNQITITFNKTPGETVTFSVNGTGTITIDGVKEAIENKGEEQDFTLSSSTITLKGLITDLNIANTSATKLDLSKCPSLETLQCNKNKLTELKVANLAELWVLDCSENQLSMLNVSQNKKLRSLYCSSNALKELDLTNLDALWELKCSDNKLSNLVLKGCVAMEEIDCSNNELVALLLDGLAKLEILKCSTNKLTSVDVAPCASLSYLFCNDNQINNLKTATTNTQLQWVECHNNKLQTIDLTKLPQLVNLKTNNNPITQLDLSANKKLTWLYCADNKLTTLDLKNNSDITVIHCQNNQLTNIDLTPVTQLWTLFCQGNKLTKLNTDACSKLLHLDCSNNQLTRLEFSEKNKRLAWLDCFDNKLQYITVKGVSELITFDCSNNNLTSLDVSTNSKLRLFIIARNKFNSQSINSIIASLPNRVKEEDAGKLFAINKCFNDEKNICTTENVAMAKLKGWGTFSYDAKNDIWNEYKGEDENTTVSQISFTTATPIGEVIKLKIDAEGEVTAEGIEKAVFTPDFEHGDFLKVTNQNIVLKGNIRGLYAEKCDLTKIDISQMLSLEVLYLDKNNLGILDASKNSKLRILSLRQAATPIVYLPKENSQLQRAELSTNGISNIDLTTSPNLNFIALEYNEKLKQVDLSNCPKLTAFHATTSGIESIDFSHNPKIEEIDLSLCNLNKLDLTGCSNLKKLDCRFNGITKLDLTQCPLLTAIDASSNNISSIDITRCPKIEIFRFSGNKISSIDLSNNPIIRVVNLIGSPLTQIDVTKNTKLRHLYLDNAKLETIDVSHNPDLVLLQLAYNKITKLSLANKPLLRGIILQGNPIEPNEMHNLIESLETVPDKNAKGKDDEGRLCIQSTADKDKKGIFNIEVYQDDVNAALQKNWKLVVFVPSGSWFGGGSYEAYGNGIPNENESIFPNRAWFVTINSNNQLTVHEAKLHEAFAIYNTDGTLVKQGVITSPHEVIDLNLLPKGEYIIKINTKPQLFLL